MTHRVVETQALLTTAEVAGLLRVGPKTVTRWANSGKLTSMRTLGGHRRYRESEILNLLGVAVSAMATQGGDADEMAATKKTVLPRSLGSGVP